VIKNVFFCLNVKYPLLSSDFNENLNVFDGFSKNIQI